MTEEQQYEVLTQQALEAQRYREEGAAAMAKTIEAGIEKRLGELVYAGVFPVTIRDVKDAVRSLTTELLTLQATGDKERARKLLEERAVIRPKVKAMLDKLDKVPVDIAPRYVTAERLLAQP